VPGEVTPGEPADWQLPPGVARGVWRYAADPDLAAGYDAALAGTPLLEADVRFAAEHFPTPGRLIDLGCGTGRLCVPFATHGYECLGVDLSAPMLGVLAAKACAAGVRVAAVRANLVALDAIRDAAFDYAACLFGTLGMIAGEEHRRRMVEHAFRVLRPGGVFVVHAHNRYAGLDTAAGRAWVLRDIVLSLFGRKGRGDRVMRGPAGVGEMTMHLFTRGELVRLLEGVGFRVTEVRPVGGGPGGELWRPGWLAGWRADGFLVAARKG
jgi:ubiquinone/menaquinone biosynthesis C-methylase UbiE